MLLNGSAPTLKAYLRLAAATSLNDHEIFTAIIITDMLDQYPVLFGSV